MQPENPDVKGLVRCRCDFCGDSFWSKRSTANYCKPSHKQKMYRWRKKLDAQTNRALNAVKEIESYLTYDRSVPTAVKALSEVALEISRVLRDQRIVGVK